MKFSAQQIATLLQGTIEGDAAVSVSRLSKIEEGDIESLSFLSNPKYEQYLYDSEAAIVVVNESQVLDPQRVVKPTMIRVKDAYQAFAELLKIYEQMRSDRSGREEYSFVHDSAELGEGYYVGAFAYIGQQTVIGKNVKVYPQVYIGDNVRIGDNSVIYPGAKIYHDCVLGSHVTVHAGAVVGSDGFGFAPQEDGSYTKVPQIGNVILEDWVEVGSNTTIDRATLGHTTLRRGVKLDNLVQIAHNVEVGENTVVAAQTGISGSTKIGAKVILGGQVGVVGHITVAPGTQVQAQSGINKTISEENKKWAGSPAFPYQGELRSQVLYAKLPELEKRIAELEKRLSEK
ncbi:UDP-3-O-(3-hydroxymyristoyl)glucosamine N-acyltransferase [Sphingobacterium sp. lm-10]|uniref:UDP-3-O-(3-hydroxymyristoyl)glucosamine N-acyltransferase n=1 Tax=Sphingobacterium sp. lm-10 TaxID=2944904 RepID=UPI0020227F4E|nr:UDP-3-O-(3-hydroxymyristoyl)glucosamine N-acyltransferase [Sphingobacterium sp. lm-10]MCL7988321.1 UDP-3-O-(3-hydroxymyristoyl)glucosamine N-acyltransferase [Sphingobacterium sp. lm-10]